MRAYSMDLRERVLAAVDRGMPRKEIVRTLGVSEPTIRRYLRLRRETGSVAPKPPPKRPFSIGQSVEQRRALWNQLEEHDDPTLEKHCQSCGRESKEIRSLSPLLHYLSGYTQARLDAHKKSLGASEGNEEHRSAWQDEVIKNIDPPRFVFVEECGTNITLRRL